MTNAMGSWKRGIAWVLALALVLQVLSACDRQHVTPKGAGSSGASTPEVAREPVDAVLLPTARLRGNDLAGFAKIVLPPPLLNQVNAAWSEGTTRWPLDELPFDEKVPELLQGLAAKGAETNLRRTFNRQFAGQSTELTSAVTALGLFGTQYLGKEGNFSTDERAHYTRLIQALSHWAASAPLADKKHAYAAITRMTTAARNTGLTSAEEFSRRGMLQSLTRLSPFTATLKQVLASYGLDLDTSLADMQVSELSRQGDRARVRMRYTIAGKPVEATVNVERIDGIWYLSDFLRNARRAIEQTVPVQRPSQASPAAMHAEQALGQ